ncbi:unnamed protein product [Cuscuta campestris]|uniref:Retrotransposon gag domain-containing protein n=1 Tax=Cuscuta campestris TaxID=132261 RepID=A0A484LM59_9ASTE|nr:unnamed protein product [Cuscuta campestris]
MTSNVGSTDVFREFQSQIDGQIQSHTAAMQQLNQAMQQLQRDLKTLLKEKQPYEGPHPRRDTPDGFVGPANSMTKLKLDMPKCDGTDPLGWLFKVHEYFVFYAVPEESRLSAVCLMLEGQALDWFRWRQRNNLLSSWTEFVTSFKLRFDPLNYVDYFGLLSKVRQTGTVLEYQQAFEKILVNVTGVEESNLQSLFHAGLKTHLQHELMLLKPSSLSESFALARELETKHAAWATSLGSRPRPTLGPFNKTPAQPLLLLPGAQQPEDKTATTPPIRRLTYAEKKDRDAKGLCYNCDEKWSKGHRCGRFLLLLEDDEEDLSPGAVDETLLMADVSTLNSMAGVTAPRSLRLSGMIAGGVVDVLIDGGSTHNFVHPRVVERLQLPVVNVAAFRVYVGNGASLLCDAQCRDVELLLQGVSFSVDVFVLPIHGPDVVLGVQWLRLLGKVTHDYANLTMDFCWKGSPVTLQGGAPEVKQVSLHHCQLLHTDCSVSACFELFLVEASTEGTADQEPWPEGLPADILIVLRRFPAAFEEPAGLPPRRLSDHRIFLQPESKPVSALYGRPPPDLVPYRPGSSRAPAVDDILAERDTLLRELRHGRPSSTAVAIHAVRTVLRNGSPEEQYLVSWSDGTLDDATWEPASSIRQHFPQLHLEDKVLLEGRGSVTGSQSAAGPCGTINEGRRQKSADEMCSIGFVGICCLEFPMLVAVVGKGILLALCSIVVFCKLFAIIPFLPRPNFKKKYRFMGGKAKCIANIIPVGLAMALGYVLPDHMECLGILWGWSMECFCVSRLWLGFCNLEAWEIYVTTLMIIFSVMSFSFWVALSIYCAHGVSVDQTQEEPIRQQEVELEKGNHINSPQLPQN